MHRTAILTLLFSFACQDDEIVWVAFNAEDEILEVAVGAPVAPCPEPAAGSEELPPCRLELESNLGVTVVGSATVEPASGPVGTNHMITVRVLDEFESLVGRATVEVKPGRTAEGSDSERGGGEFELRRDSADVGAYALTLQSFGAPDEQGTDEFVIHLFQPEQLTTEPDP